MKSFLHTLLSEATIVNSEVGHLKRETIRTASATISAVVAGLLLMMGVVMLHLAVLFALIPSMGVPGALTLVGLIAVAFGAGALLTSRLWLNSR